MTKMNWARAKAPGGTFKRSIWAATAPKELKAKSSGAKRRSAHRKRKVKTRVKAGLGARFFLLKDDTWSVLVSGSVQAGAEVTVQRRCGGTATLRITKVSGMRGNEHACEFTNS